jgi:Mn-dependent DtxR family transcriptional regulator
MAARLEPEADALILDALLGGRASAHDLADNVFAGFEGVTAEDVVERLEALHRRGLVAPVGSADWDLTEQGRQAALRAAEAPR